MAERIVIDPLTRIEGHLKIEVEVENGVVKDAWCAGTMARGWEILLRDRDPRDAPYVCSRVCSVCEGVHAIASSQALDDAFGVNIPEAGRIMRNLFCAGLYMHDHFIQFYVLSALDYIDIMAVANYKGSDAGLLAVKDKIVGLVNKNDTAPFTPRYTPDEYCVADPDIVTTLVSHYIKAVEMKAKSHKMLSILTGIQPTANSIMPGGCSATPTAQQLSEFRTLWQEQLDFVTNTYLPDVLFVGKGPLLPLALSGFGKGNTNYLCYPMFPQHDSSSAADRSFGGSNHLMGGGVVIGGSAKQSVDYSKITEDVKYTWSNYPVGTNSLHPSVGVTEFAPKKIGDAYSFVKAPRYNGLTVEVGPLARGMVNINTSTYNVLKDLVSQGAQPGVVARHLCRALEAKAVGDAGLAWIDRLIELATAGPIVGMKDVPVPGSAKGMGAWDAPRGALAHWVDIDGGRIKNYQLVVPSTWNQSPRDSKGIRGQNEEALIGAPVPDVNNPINLVRIVRSFDPCLACAIHLIDPKTNDIKVFKVG